MRALKIILDKLLWRFYSTEPVQDHEVMYVDIGRRDSRLTADVYYTNAEGRINITTFHGTYQDIAYMILGIAAAHRRRCIEIDMSGPGVALRDLILDRYKRDPWFVQQKGNHTVEVCGPRIKQFREKWMAYNHE